MFNFCWTVFVVSHVTDDKLCGAIEIEYHERDKLCVKRRRDYFSNFLVGCSTKFLTRRGLLLGILGGGVPPGSQNPDPISGQKLSFPPAFWPEL